MLGKTGLSRSQGICKGGSERPQPSRVEIGSIERPNIRGARFLTVRKERHRWSFSEASEHGNAGVGANSCDTEINAELSVQGCVCTHTPMCVSHRCPQKGRRDTPITMCTPCTQILFPRPPPWRGSRAPGKWQRLALGEGNEEKSMEDFVVLGTKEVLRQWWRRV